ncbi:MAG: glycoside hydrolase family 47 protein [bacterium]
MTKKFYLMLILLHLFNIFFNCSRKENELQDKGNSINTQLLAEKVKKEFIHAWNGYKQYAWEHDDLKPLSKGYHDWYGESLLMTPVDALSTMLIMGLNSEAAQAKKLILKKLDFNKSIDVQLFEINIRLLGGLLSAYQLDGDKRLLDLAQDLADRLLPAFSSPTGMPFRYVNLQTGQTKDPINNPAEIGTLMLEWGTLSKITGNPIYYEKTKKAVQAVFQRRSELDLVGTAIDIETGEWVNTDSHISACIDSYYEYLFKSWLMFRDEDFKKMWDVSIKAIHKHLADTVKGNLWYGWTKMVTGNRTHTYFGALDAFFPAVLSLSGDITRAEKLHESCYNMWMLHDIEPELIDYKTMETKADYYLLRPENIESTYYLYHFTNDPEYLDIGKIYFESVVKYCKNEVGYSHLKSVKTKEKMDAMQSFFLAETLKYFYLLFSSQDAFDFDKKIFNTEAHPLNIW